jgi:small conductance mechanosensitive channel
VDNETPPVDPSALADLNVSGAMDTLLGFFNAASGVLWTVVVACLTMVAGWVIGKIAKKAVLGIFSSKKIGSVALARFVSDLVRYLILAVAVIAAIEKMGVQTTSVLTILASAGLAVGLALQGSLAHFASGVMLLIFRPFDVGDVITAGGHTGQVQDVGLFATTLHTPDAQKIIVPNGTISGGAIVNITALGKRRGVVGVGVAYGTSIEKVVEICTKAASSVEAVHGDPGVTVAFVNMAASAVEFNVLYFTDGADYLPTLHAVRAACYDALNAEGIEIPFDQVVMHQAPA